MQVVTRWVIGIVVVLVIVVGITMFFKDGTSVASFNKAPTSTTSPVTIETYHLNKYADQAYGFSFWSPSELDVTATTTDDTTDFPGGVAVETLQIGPLGGTSIIVVNSTTSSITDEPANHASPIAQTEYFYDQTSEKWMVAFPQGGNGVGGENDSTTTADVSKTTISGLVMLPSGKRFDTTIIPLTTTRFLVISDGGGSSFTYELAKTISQIGASIDPTAQANALQAEAAAYSMTK